MQFGYNERIAPPPAPRPLARYVDSDDYFIRNARRISQLHNALDDSSLPSRKNQLSYSRWLQNRRNQRQEDIVQRILHKLQKNKTNWQIDFEVLTNYGRKRIFEPLKDFMQNEIGYLSANSDFKISFAVQNGIHYR